MCRPEGDPVSARGERRLRVLLADDDARVRSDVRRVLTADGRFAVCAEATEAAGAVEHALRQLPDVCLLVVRMPGGGIAAAWEISRRLPTTKVVILTVSSDDADLLAAVRAGACGYLLKETGVDALPEALVGVVTDGATIPGALLARVVEQFRDPMARRSACMADDLEERLTACEWEILALLRHGLSTADMADRLSLSRLTIRRHVGSTLKKLKLKGRDEARYDGSL